MKKKWKKIIIKTLIKNHGNIKDIFMCNKIQKRKKKQKLLLYCLSLTINQ